MELNAAYDLACALLVEHGLAHWQVTFDAAKRRAGVCDFAERRIGLSAPLTRLHDDAQVRDTILHEIAHALAGPRHAHDQHWRRIAIAIGSSGDRCTPADAPRVPAAWLGVCPSGHVVERHRRPERVASCRECSTTFDLAHALTWTRRGRPARMHPNYEAELDALTRGQAQTRFSVGSRVRVSAQGEWQGQQGTVVKLGRTSYHLRVGRSVLRVPFALVEGAR
ncbi:SprT-like domain-containing protein [Nocardioides insulae]|uniref:SprT-like domain-containing protein n=1 Tax=Nocardioides insulae TaxID=394734 RepID=UPI0004263225|nr:SprT-like domain-containing protein [Nocardioides insulae]